MICLRTTAHASKSVDKILAYWTAYVHPLEQALCSKQTCRNYCDIGGLPLYPESEMQARRTW